MKNGTNALARQGDTIAHRSGPVLVVLSCIRPDAAYRVSVCYGSTGAEIDALSKSFPTEAQARTMARSASVLFSDGRPVAQVLADLDAIHAEAARQTKLMVVEAALDANVKRASSRRRYAEENVLGDLRDGLLDPSVRADLDARRAFLRDELLAAWAPAPQPTAAPAPDADGTLFALFIPTMRGAA